MFPAGSLTHRLRHGVEGGPGGRMREKSNRWNEGVFPNRNIT